MVPSRDCVLCRIQATCPDGTLFLHAATPILREIVAAHLDDIGVRYLRESDLFCLSRQGNGGGTMQVVQNLRSRLSDAECADIRVSSDKGAAWMGAQTLDTFGESFNTAWFDEALRNDRFTTFFQPIVHASKTERMAPRVFAHECLIRLFADRAYNGGEIIEAAVSRRSIHSFDSYARRLSIRLGGAQFRRGGKLFINFMPSSIYDPAFCMASTLEEMSKTDIRAADVVFEVVESDHVRDVKHLQKICDYYRKAGFGFAMDDVGTGSNSLQTVCDLKPDFVKLDKSLISKMDQPMYRTAVQKLAEFSDQYGVKVIAEGVETVETMDALLAVGITYMQGYYFGKPSATIQGSDLIRLSAILGQTAENSPEGAGIEVRATVPSPGGAAR